jgi:predicted ATP-grasp superfamily ATP-dependent carboligase
MTGNVLLTLGRLPKALDVARGFADLGWRVVVAEPFKRHLAGASRAVTQSHRVTAPAEDKQAYLADLRRIIAEEKIDLVVPVSEETMHVAFLRDNLPATTQLFTMRSRPAVLKPVHSCSGRGVRLLPPGSALPAPDPAVPAIVQRYILGEEYSSCSIAHEGRVSSTVIYRAAQKSGSVAVAFERVENPAISDWITRFIAAANWTGFIAFDIIVNEAGQPLGIECNPRTTSGLHFWQRADIARAVVEPGFIPRFRPETRLQQFYSALTETQMSLFRRGPFRENLRQLFSTRDVTWDWHDPMPFLTMTATSWPIIRMAMARGVTFGAVATLDVGWYD